MDYLTRLGYRPYSMETQRQKEREIMKAINWNTIGAAGSFSKLPAGGYVVTLTGVSDNFHQEYVECVYDIAEGEHAGHFSDDWGKQHPYAHQFRRYYTEKSTPFFKAFLVALQESNPGRFNIDSWAARGSNEQEFLGLKLGVVVQYEDYTKNNGDDGERMNVEAFTSADAIRSGNFTIPERKDTRKKVSTTSDGGWSDDVPFDL